MTTNASQNGLSQHTIQAAGFINSLGVGMHIPYTDGGYASLGNDAADLAYLGLNNVRDGVSDGVNGSAPLSSFITLAQQGVKFTFVIAGGGALTTASLQAELGLYDQINMAVLGSIVAVEGSNEINNAPITFNGVGGLQGALDLQRALYAAVHADTNLAGVAVDYFTGYNAGSVAVGPDPTATAGLADYDTQHPYPNNGDAPAAWVTPSQSLGNESASTGYGPAVFTETGYSTNGGTTGGVNADVQAKYTLDLLLDDAANGISRTYLYQLMDAYKPGSPQGDDGFGLFDPSNTPKAAATAIHNLVGTLADTAATASTFTPATLGYSVTGLPSTGNSLALEKADGTYDVAVWNEPKIWDEATGTETTAATQNVTVQLGGTYATVEVFDPLASATAVSVLHNVSSVQLGLTDHPLLVQIEPGSPATPPATPPATLPATPSVTVGTGPDSLVLQVSEDAYNGDAQFTVSIDGTQVGGTQTATASQAAGADQAFTVEGSFGVNQHTVGVNFLNDAYGGTSQTDRNLYVDAASYDGTTVSPDTLRLMSGGMQFLTVGTAAPVFATLKAGSGSDVVALKVSEDAYKGDAQFTVSVDGKQVGGAFTATALHAAGQSQEVDLSGSWGKGAHIVTVNFLNGGTANADRNLYVTGASYDGVAQTGATLSLLSGGPQSFGIAS